MRESEVETPALILDLDAFEFNLDTMARRVAEVGARLRPHAKTHKSPVVANLQMRRGAIGQCVQKVAEAEAMAWGGVEDILVTNQIVDPRKLAKANFICATTLLRRQVIVDAGGYDDGFRMLREDWELYLRLWSRGYRGGGFNGRPATLGAATIPYDPETLDNYEAGFKTEFAGGRVRDREA